MLYRTALAGIVTLVLSSDTTAKTADKWSFGGTYRLRYENLNNTFRADAGASDQILVSRLLASVKASGEHLLGEFELEDSRAWLDDDGSPLGTDDVNAVEPLQAYVGWRQQGESKFTVKAGRMTLNIGNRRMVSRNGFRNTINAFTGIHGAFKQGNWQGQALYTLPLQRRPSNRDELDNNEVQLDKHYSGIRFGGLHLTHTNKNKRVFQAYYFTLEEEDQPDLRTRNRSLNTIGFRIFQPTQANNWDYGVEAAYQFGDARASAALSDNNDLDVKASFINFHLGYQFSDAWNSQMVFQTDYATGDDDPNDSEYNRFDTLFGSRGFDYGQTGIYGAFARSNILSSALKWKFKPHRMLSNLISYRAVWLASEKDAFTTAGVVDPSGNTNRFIGQQLQATMKVTLSSLIQLEFGSLYLFKGAFLEDAPNAPDTGDTSYVYSQITFRL